MTLGLAMSALPACAESSTLGDSGPRPMIDSGREGIDADAIADAAAPADAHVTTDAHVRADAGAGEVCPPGAPLTTEACCEAVDGGFWDETEMACYLVAPGPFVPPVAHV